MGYDGSLKFDTSIVTDGFNSGLKKLGSLAKTGMAAVAGSVAGIAGAAIKVGSDFESQMSKVQAISGATGNDLIALSEKAKEMGASTKFSATESGQAMEYMAMAGWKTSDMLNGIEGVMNLAAAAGEDLATTSDIVTDALTAFGLAASDSTHFADVLAQTASNANTTVAGLGESFKYVAPVAGSLGYSVEDTSVALGLMANAGIKAGQAGTSLRAIINGMVSPTSDAEAAMSKLGVSLTDSSGKMKPLSEVITDLREGFGKLSESERAQAAAAIAGQEGMSGLLAIVSASDKDFQKLTQSIDGCDGAAADMAETMSNNLKGQITILKSSLEGLGIEIYESLSKPLTNLSKLGIEAVNQLTNAFKSDGLDGLIDVGTGIIADIITGIAQSTPQVISMILGIIQALTESITAETPQLITAAGKIIMALATGMVQLLPTLGSFGLQMITKIGDSISSSAPTLIPKALEMVGQLAMGFIQALPQLISTGIQIITAIAQGLINSIPILIEYVPQIINGFCAALDTGLFQLIAAGAKIIAQLVIGLLQALPQLIAAMPQIVLAIYNVFMHINMFSAAKNIVSSLAKGLKSAGSGLIGAAQNVVKFIWNQLVHTDWLSLGKLLMQKVASGIRGMGGSVGSVAKTVGTKAVNAIKNINWAEVGRLAIQKVASGITGLAGRLGTAAKNAGQKAVSAFKGINWANVGKNIISGIVGGIGAAAGALYSKLKDVAGNALSAAKKALGIHSPSRRFKNEVGRYIVTGIIAGINGTKNALLKTMDTLSVSLLKKAKNANGNYSDIGKSFVESFTNSINSKAKSAITAGKNLINKQIDAAKKKNPKAKDAYTKLGKAMVTAYTNAINSESKKLIAAAEKNIEELSETYQKKYDEIIQNRDDMISKMRDAGSLYDLDGNIEALEEYQKRLKGLKSKIPDSLMNEILGMDIADANDYMEYLQSMDPKQLEEYLKKWDKIYTGSSSFGKSFFSSDLKELKSNYEKELQVQLKDLQKKMKQMGIDVMKGFTSGMKSQTKNMSKTVQSMCDQLIKDIRKKLKIKSPSRIMRDKIGKYLPLGISSGFRKWMPEATKQIGKDIDGALNAMRAKVESIEYPKPSPVYVNPVQTQAPIVVEDNRPIEINGEIHTHVELDKREVGYSVTPYVDKKLGDNQSREERRN